jgi:long-chain acyl-CoA synthetase
MKVQRCFVLEALQAKHPEGTGPSFATAADAGLIYDIIRSLSNAPADRIVPAATLGLDLQIDSLSRVELVSIIEEELQVELDESLITDKTSIAELEEFIAAQKKTPGSKSRLWPLTRWAVCARWLLQAGFIRPVSSYYMKLRVLGKEKFDGLDKPFLLIANHISHLDAVVLTMALPWHVRKRIAVAAAADAFQEWDSSQAPFKERIGRKAATALALLGLNIFLPMLRMRK